MPAEVFLKMGLAVLMGGILGYEREWRGRPAGLRTHILVCLASSLLMSVSWAMKDGASPFEPGRLAAGIVTGMGFIGAGTIIHLRNTTHGLTTAASVWLVAVLGIVTGSGFYLAAMVATVVAFIVLRALQIVEKHLRRYTYYAVSIRSGGELDDIRRLENFLADRKFAVTATRVTSNGSTGVNFVDLDLRHLGQADLGELARDIREVIGHPCRVTVKQ